MPILFMASEDKPLKGRFKLNRTGPILAKYSEHTLRYQGLTMGQCSNTNISQRWWAQPLRCSNMKGWSPTKEIVRNVLARSRPRWRQGNLQLEIKLLLRVSSGKSFKGGATAARCSKAGVASLKVVYLELDTPTFFLCAQQRTEL